MPMKSVSHVGFDALIAEAAAPDGGIRTSPDADREQGRLSDLAHRRFRKALFDGRLQPGATVSQSDLVKLLDVPVGPLRDALRVLQAEGLLTIHARSGIEIRKPDLNLLRHTYQMRLILERPAVRLFAEAAPMADIEALVEAHHKAIAMVDGRDFADDEPPAIEALDRRFHMRLIGALANPLVDTAYAQSQSFVRLIRMDRHFRYSTVIAVRTFQEHIAILEAMRHRDSAAAEAALEAHFTKAMQRAMGFF